MQTHQFHPLAGTRGGHTLLFYSAPECTSLRVALRGVRYPPLRAVSFNDRYTADTLPLLSSFQLQVVGVQPFLHQREEKIKRALTKNDYE